MRGRIRGCAVCCVGVLALLADTGDRWLSPDLTRTTEIELEREVRSLARAARTMHWCAAWAPAVRHRALCDELRSRAADREDHYGDRAEWATHEPPASGA